jgi:uncharacterized protein (DUF2249 family)
VPVVIDGRNLQPPEPLERALAALDILADDDELTLLLHCQPVPLLEILARTGYGWHETLLADGTHRITIRRRANG